MKPQEIILIRKTTIIILVFFQTFALLAQNPKEHLLDQLNKVDSLLSGESDKEAKEILDTFLPSIIQQPKEVQIRYYSLLGGFYLGASQFKQSITAYEQIKDLSPIGLSKEIVGIQARAMNDLGIAYIKNGEIQKAKEAHFYSLKLYGDDPQGKSFNYGNLAIIYKELKFLDSAYYCYDMAQKADVLAKDTAGMAFHSLSMGILQVDNSEPIKALESLNKAKRIFRQLKNDRMTHYTNRLLAGTYKSIRDYSLSRSLLFEARDFFISTNDNVRLGLTNLDIGELYYRQEKYDSGFFFINEGLANFDSAQYVKGLIKAYNLVGRYYIKKEDYPQAKDSYKRSIELSGDSFKGMTANSSLALARIALKQEKLDNALELANTAFQISEGSLQEGSERSYYQILFEVNKKKGNLSNALHYLELLDKIKSETFNQERANEIARIEYNAKLELEQERLELEKKQQAEIYEKELEKEQLIQQSAIAGGILVLIILIAVYRSYNIKKQLNRNLTEKNSLLSEKNIEINKLRKTERELAEETLALKERELTTITMLSHERNSLLQQLGSQIGTLSEKVDDEVIPDLKEIKKTINSNLTDESWTYFMYQFEKVHPDYFNKLKTKFPVLTQHDLRICAYTRMGMGRKEIATMTNVTPEAVKKSLYRLRKKLDLEEGTDLSVYLMEI